ncbi:MAG: winged helix-turn-helix transcriptional regulator [Planctomycetaceae bacterium]|nr:winged helix-turn-helix transcriptional regulator [Planctomycetaceae bacterium]
MLDVEDCSDDRCAVYLKALGDPIRLGIVRVLQAGPRTVTELANSLEQDLQKISHHLQVLFHSDVINQHRKGKFRYYELNPTFLKGRPTNRILDFGCCKIGLASDKK